VTSHSTYVCSTHSTKWLLTWDAFPSPIDPQARDTRPDQSSARLPLGCLSPEPHRRLARRGVQISGVRVSVSAPYHSRSPRSRVPLWTQVERAHCGALLRADQDVAATREGTMWNQVGRAAILAVILMNIHEMTRG